MAHCPECETTIASTDDLVFEDVDSNFGLLSAPKRYYVATCAACGNTIGSGVAAASNDGAAAAGAGGGC